MKRKDMIEKIIATITRTKDELVEAGVNDKSIDILMKRMNREKTKSVYIQGVYKVMDNLDTKHRELTDVKNLLLPGVWKRYKMMGFDTLTEMVMLKCALFELKETWKSIPMYRRADHEKKLEKKKRNKGAGRHSGKST